MKLAIPSLSLPLICLTRVANTFTIPILPLDARTRYSSIHQNIQSQAFARNTEFLQLQSATVDTNTITKQKKNGGQIKKKRRNQTATVHSNTITKQKKHGGQLKRRRRNQSVTAATNTTPKEQKHDGQIKKRRRNNVKKLKPGAYHDLSDDELREKTMILLESCVDIGGMTSGQAHEAGKQLISWSKRRSLQSGEMSELLLHRLILDKDAGNQSSKPSVKLFNHCMNAWTKSGHEDGYQKALDLLKDMNTFVQTHREVLPKQHQIEKCYVTVIDGCCKAKTRTSADIAKELLGKMDSGRQLRHYNAVLNSYASMYDHISVLDLFWQMKELSKTDRNMTPNRTTYNIVIKSLSGSKDMRCVQKAEEILLEMEQAFYEGNKYVSPDKISYTSILAAWSRVCNKQAVEKAEMYLDKMSKMYMKGNEKVKPDLVTYNTVLSIIANSGTADAGERSLKILDKMELLHELGDEVKPNLISYNAVLKTFAKNSYIDGARKSIEILTKLENDEHLRPDIITYNSCLNAFAKAKDPVSAQLLLERMENRYSEGHSVKPDTYSYNTLISAWAFSGHDYGAEIAETIFDRMETSQIRLDTTTFNTLLSAWARQKDPERATDILHHMFAVKRSKRYDVTPTRQSFAIVINAWAKTSYPRKASKARELLLEMSDRSIRNKNLKPNAYIYASVLNACAYTYGNEEVRAEALTIAIETFKECTERNDVVYGTFIKTCKTLMDAEEPGRSEFIKNTFELCKKKGLVSDFVLHELYSALCSSQYIAILGLDTEEVLSIKDVPKRWSRNITRK